MAAIRELYAQVYPETTSQVVAYTGQRGLSEVTRIVVCNTSSSRASFSIFHRPQATGAADRGNALYFEKSIDAHDTFLLSDENSIVLKQGGRIIVQSNVSGALTFSIYGSTSIVGENTTSTAGRAGIGQLGN